MRNHMYILIIILWVIFGCGSRKDFLKYKYQFSDSLARNIHISFRRDSTFLLLNGVRGLSYSFVGRWEQLDDNILVLTNPYIDLSQNEIVDKAPGPGEKIDEHLAAVDRRYIFPAIASDSITFTNRYKNFSLKGFEFKRTSRKHFKNLRPVILSLRKGWKSRESTGLISKVYKNE